MISLGSWVQNKEGYHFVRNISINIASTYMDISACYWERTLGAVERYL